MRRRGSHYFDATASGSLQGPGRWLRAGLLALALCALSSGQAAAQSPNRPQADAHIDRIAPNPFNPVKGPVDIEYVLTVAVPITIQIFSIDGRSVASVVDQYMESGSHTARWDGRAGDGSFVANGVYVCQIQVGTLVRSQLLVVAGCSDC